jgi:Protein of unknown function DUF45
MKSRGVVTYGADLIEDEVRFTARSSLEISVHPDGRVEVVAPHEISSEALEERLRARGRWIRRQQPFFSQYRPRTTPRQYVNGETHLYFGRQYRLRLSSAEADQIKLVGGRSSSHRVARCHRRRLPECWDWYRLRARVKFRERFGACLPTLRASRSCTAAAPRAAAGATLGQSWAEWPDAAQHASDSGAATSRRSARKSKAPSSTAAV